MIKELCEICQHSGYDYRYKFKTLICNIDRKTPKYKYYCEKVSLKNDEKTKIIEDIQAEVNKQNRFWKRLEPSKINYLDEKCCFNVNSDFKLEFKNNKFYHLIGLISLLIIISIAIYYLSKSDFVWFGAAYSFLVHVACIILLKTIYDMSINLFNNEIQLIIDSNGINDITNRFIPWELMFNVYIEKDNSSEGFSEYYIHIWSLFGNYKISLHNLKFDLTETENIISYYKNCDKFNKLRITERS